MTFRTCGSHLNHLFWIFYVYGRDVLKSLIFVMSSYYWTTFFFFNSFLKSLIKRLSFYSCVAAIANFKLVAQSFDLKLEKDWILCESKTFFFFFSKFSLRTAIHSTIPVSTWMQIPLHMFFSLKKLNYYWHSSTEKYSTFIPHFNP